MDGWLNIRRGLVEKLNFHTVGFLDGGGGGGGG